ncbi:hypothetical protein EV421DRAFT_2015385 [Armillaria borealis]|uniref:Uncharacterized protein n=1 Tax=Armillaria borealis TaxID=47425 RepID=A0AA39N0E2_9AGAR|nr:hypothetical protein EV421DRAFT_2015385 [Armillaria borealis]
MSMLFSLNLERLSTAPLSAPAYIGEQGPRKCSACVWSEDYGARSTLEKPGLAFAFNSGLSTLLLVWRARVQSLGSAGLQAHGRVLREVSSFQSSASSSNNSRLVVHAFSDNDFRPAATFRRPLIFATSRLGTVGTLPPTYPHGILDNNVCAAAIYRHLASVVLLEAPPPLPVLVIS